MSSFDCDLDFEASRGPPDGQRSSIELEQIFGGDDPQEPMEANESNGLYEAANSSVTQKFCRPGRTTPLSSDEGAVLWERLRHNGYAPCSIKIGSKKPFGDG